MRATFHSGMRRGRVEEPERGVNHRPDLTGGDQRPDLDLDRARDRRLIGGRTCPQRRAGMGQPLEHEAAEVDGRARRSLESDLQDSPFDRRRVIVAVDVVAADDVEYEIGAAVGGRFLGRRDKILALIVNGDVGAELDARFAFLRRTGGRDDTGAKRLGELNGSRADPGRAAVNERGFARRERARTGCTRR